MLETTLHDSRCKVVVLQTHEIDDDDVVEAVADLVAGLGEENERNDSAVPLAYLQCFRVCSASAVPFLSFSYALAVSSPPGLVPHARHLQAFHWDTRTDLDSSKTILVAFSNTVERSID